MPKSSPTTPAGQQRASCVRSGTCERQAPARLQYVTPNTHGNCSRSGTNPYARPPAAGCPLPPGRHRRPLHPRNEPSGTAGAPPRPAPPASLHGHAVQHRSHPRLSPVPASLGPPGLARMPPPAAPCTLSMHTRPVVERRHLRYSIVPATVVLDASGPSPARAGSLCLQRVPASWSGAVHERKGPYRDGASVEKGAHAALSVPESP